MEKISRFGAYGILVQDQKILLSVKKGGPYRGRLDLPGGRIEFGETPEEALKREFIEEVAIQVDVPEFLYHSTATVEYQNQDGPYLFHQVGIIYRILKWQNIANSTPEEESHFIELEKLSIQSLTPFAKEAVYYLRKQTF